MKRAVAQWFRTSFAVVSTFASYRYSSNPPAVLTLYSQRRLTSFRLVRCKAPFRQPMNDCSNIAGLHYPLHLRNISFLPLQPRARTRFPIRSVPARRPGSFVAVQTTKRLHRCPSGRLHQSERLLRAPSFSSLICIHLHSRTPECETKCL